MDAISKIQSLQLELNRFSPARQPQASAVQQRPAEQPVKADSSPKEEVSATEGKDRSVSAGLDLEA